jgi:hypothetical protein
MAATDYSLITGITLAFVQGWSHKVYASMFINDIGNNPTTLTLTDLTNCTWNDSTKELTPGVGYAGFSFKLVGSTTTISGTALPVTWNNISVSYLKNLLESTANTLSGLCTATGINQYSKIKPNGAAPHKFGEFRGYCHQADGRFNLYDVTNLSAVGYGNSYDIKTIVSKQQNTSDFLEFKLQVFKGSDLIQEFAANTLDDCYHKLIVSNSFTNNNEYTVNQEYTIKTLIQTGENVWTVTNTNTFTISLEGVAIIGSWVRGTTLSKSISFTIYTLRQSSQSTTFYPRATVTFGGEVYQCTDGANGMSIAMGYANYTLTLNWQNLAGMTTANSPVLRFWLQTASGGGLEYTLTEGAPE